MRHKTSETLLGIETPKIANTLATLAKGHKTSETLLGIETLGSGKTGKL